jgi:hypothetical protein
MGGPIVRSGSNPEFSEGWDRIFGQGAKKPKQPDSPQKDSLDEEGHKEVGEGGAQEGTGGEDR